MAIDVHQELVDLFTDNWNSANTSGTTPLFLKITDKKKHDFRDNIAIVMIHRKRGNPEKAGIGTTPLRIRDTVPIDIRILGFDNEDLFYEIIEETNRILYANIIWTESANFSELNPEAGIEQDLSNESKGMWRFLKEIHMIDHVRSR